CHDLLDLLHKGGCCVVDLVGLPHRREILLVDAVDVRLRQLSAGLDDVVDQLVDGRMMTGGVVVPNLVVARIGGLLERLDLVERNLCKGVACCAVLSLGFHDVPMPILGLLHMNSAQAVARQRAPTLGDTDKCEVNCASWALAWGKPPKVLMTS